MADGQITFRQPSGSSPSIPDVVVDCYIDAGNFYSSTITGLASVAGYSTLGTAQIVVGAVTARVFTVSGVIPDTAALDIGALAIWSSEEYKAQRDGHLEMIVECEYTEAEPSPHSETLLETLTTAYGYEYGYPVIDGVLSLPPDYKRRRGITRDGVLQSLVQVVFTEV